MGVVVVSMLPSEIGLSVGLYNEFKHEPGIVEIDFPVFMLFIGVAISITAFPVLCRILTELKLLMTPVGVIVLAAGVGNDVVGEVTPPPRVCSRANLLCAQAGSFWRSVSPS